MRAQPYFCEVCNGELDPEDEVVGAAMVIDASQEGQPIADGVKGYFHARHWPKPGWAERERGATQRIAAGRPPPRREGPLTDELAGRPARDDLLVTDFARRTTISSPVRESVWRTARTTNKTA